MTLQLDSRWIPLLNRSTLQTEGNAWPVEIVLSCLDAMGAMDVEFIANGASKGGIATTKIVYENSANRSTTPGTIQIYDSSLAQWVPMTQELLAELFSDIGQVQPDWTEASTSASSYIRNRPADVTTAEFLQKVASRLLINGEVWAALAPTALTISSSAVAVDLETGIDFSLTMTENAQLSNFTSKTVGQRGVIEVTQDATGNRLLTYGSEFEFIGGTALTLSTGANAVDEISYRVRSDTVVRLSIDKNWS